MILWKLTSEGASLLASSLHESHVIEARFQSSRKKFHSLKYNFAGGLTARLNKNGPIDSISLAASVPGSLSIASFNSKSADGTVGPVGKVPWYFSYLATISHFQQLSF